MQLRIISIVLLVCANMTFGQMGLAGIVVDSETEHFSELNGEKCLLFDEIVIPLQRFHIFTTFVQPMKSIAYQSIHWNALHLFGRPPPRN